MKLTFYSADYNKRVYQHHHAPNLILFDAKTILIEKNKELTSVGFLSKSLRKVTLPRRSKIVFQWHCDCISV